MRTLSHCRRLF